MTADVETTQATDCPAWCHMKGTHVVHECVSLFGEGVVAVTVDQYAGWSPEPTMTLWRHGRAGRPIRELRISPADAVKLAEILASVPPEELKAFAAAMVSAAVILGEPMPEVAV